jgi:glycine C-acetyltransferase
MARWRYQDKFPDTALLGRDGVLTKSLMRFYRLKGPHVLKRTEKCFDWVCNRIEAGVMPHYFRLHGKPTQISHVEDLAGTHFDGINLTVVDYLGLSTHPEILAAARDALDTGCVHSVSTGPLMGNSPASVALEDAVGDLLGYSNVVLFPTGWAASFGGISGLVRDSDFIVIDELAHQSLQQGAYASTQNVTKFSHLNNAAAINAIADIRAKNPTAGILVVTEGLYSMDGDAPEFPELLAGCKAHGAVLLVDVCHDLGSIGPNGSGSLGKAGLLGDPDVVVVGAFSKAFCTNGGFFASAYPGAECLVRAFAGPYTYSTALSPVQIAIARRALEISIGEEGDILRRKLNENIAVVRERAKSLGLLVYGSPTPIVSIDVGSEAHARLASAKAFHSGVVTTILEFPVVAFGKARFRLSMSPTHDKQQLIIAVDRIAQCIAWAKDFNLAL